MKKILTHTLGALALTLLIVAPAAADVNQTPATQAPATAEAPLDFLDGAVEAQVPADLPNRGFACVLPPQQQDENCVCPAIFDPVCGCNDVTYSNACFASCEVRTWDEGACNGTTI